MIWWTPAFPHPQSARRGKTSPPRDLAHCVWHRDRRWHSSRGGRSRPRMAARILKAPSQRRRLPPRRASRLPHPISADRRRRSTRGSRTRAPKAVRQQPPGRRTTVVGGAAVQDHRSCTAATRETKQVTPFRASRRGHPTRNPPPALHAPTRREDSTIRAQGSARPLPPAP